MGENDQPNQSLNYPQINQNFNRMESLIIPKLQADDKAKNLSITVNEMVNLVSNELNQGIESTARNRHVIDYLNNRNIAVNRSSNNQKPFKCNLFIRIFQLFWTKIMKGERN